MNSGDPADNLESCLPGDSDPVSAPSPAALPRRIQPDAAIRILAGLETGFLGALLMLAWVALTSVWAGERWYEVPNLWATAIWGREALYRHLGMMTLGGACFHIVLASLIGAIFSLIFGVFTGGLRLIPAGVMTGVAWFGFFAWRNRLFALNAPEPEVLTAYVLFGAMLMRVSRRGRILQRALDAHPEPWKSAPSPSRPGRLL